MGDDVFAEIKALDRGDWIGAQGTVMTTRTGEISVKVTSLELLAKAIRPLPDKWHGLADPDVRYRQRYADLAVNPTARRVFEIRHAVLTSFRTRWSTVASSRSRHPSFTPIPAAPMPARSSPTTTRWTFRCTCASPPSCTSSA